MGFSKLKKFEITKIAGKFDATIRSLNGHNFHNFWNLDIIFGILSIETWWNIWLKFQKNLELIVGKLPNFG